MASSRCVCHCRKLIHLNRHSARVFSVSHRSDIKPDTQEENILTKPIDSGVSKPLDPTEKLHQDFITKTRETKDDIVSSSPSPAPYPGIFVVIFLIFKLCKFNGHNTYRDTCICTT